MSRELIGPLCLGWHPASGAQLVELASWLELAHYTNEHKVLLGLLGIGQSRAEPSRVRAK
jgi:hypothetical protein